MSNCKDLIKLCEGHHIYIQTHNFPDPDAIASAFGLQKILEYFNISSTLCYAGKIDKLSTKKMTQIFNIKIYSYESIIDNMCEEDYIICVDSQKNGGNITDFIGNEFACIDHHPIYVETNYAYNDIRMVGACSTIIASYYKELNIPIDKAVASALIYGLKMDTLNFSRGTTMLDIDIFKFLFEKSDNVLLKNLEHNNMEFDDLKAYGTAIENIKIYGTIGFSFIPFSCTDALIGIISEFILDLNNIDVTIIYSKREDGYKFSIRSENPFVDAGKVINLALSGLGNGGGHTSMAGGLIPTENLEKLGEYPETYIAEKFLNILQQPQN